MLLKHADDQSKRLALLENLKQSPVLNMAQREWVDKELTRLRLGIQGEREAAFHLESEFKDGTNHVLMHDLRFEVDGEVAQIDHLVINRAIGMYLIETKNFSGNLIINDHGEFTVDYGSYKFGIPSPIEQSKRHERVLNKLLKQLGIAPRFSAENSFHHVVVLHPRAIIKRPPAKVFDTSMVIKADQFSSWRAKFVDKKIDGAGLLVALANMRGQDTIKEWAEMLMRQHRPADLLALPDFMKPQPHSTPHPVKVSEPPAAYVSPAKPAAPTAPNLAKKLICAHCNTKISYPEGKFCWNNERRFGGLQYCREHQALF